MKTIFEQGAPGHGLSLLPACDVPVVTLAPARKKPLHLPQVSENELIRHYTALSHRVHGMNDGFYPLGSCTMKYNPKVNEALAARSSSRDFSPEMLSLEELSGVLWAAAGVNREDGHLTAPSAMALYPIRVYAFLPEGVYRYDSKANVLNRVIEGDRRELTAMQDFAYTAPLNLVYVADYSVYADRNQPVDRIRFWCAADAGGYTENVNLYAAGNGLKAITRGSFKEEALLELLGLDPAQYGVILAQTVGR